MDLTKLRYSTKDRSSKKREYWDLMKKEKVPVYKLKKRRVL